MQTRFAKIDDAHVAYGVFGDGPQDMLLFLGEYIPVDAIDEEPRYARALRRLASTARIIVFNPRGVGLSGAADEAPTPVQHARDACAVLDAVGSKQVIAFAWNVAGPTAIHFVNEYANRVS